jgi:hypothetical protein
MSASSPISCWSALPERCSSSQVRPHMEKRARQRQQRQQRWNMFRSIGLVEHEADSLSIHFCPGRAFCAEGDHFVVCIAVLVE